MDFTTFLICVTLYGWFHLSLHSIGFLYNEVLLTFSACSPLSFFQKPINI